MLCKIYYNKMLILRFLKMWFMQQVTNRITSDFALRPHQGNFNDKGMVTRLWSHETSGNTAGGMISGVIYKKTTFFCQITHVYIKPYLLAYILEHKKQLAIISNKDILLFIWNNVAFCATGGNFAAKCF